MVDSLERNAPPSPAPATNALGSDGLHQEAAAQPRASSLDQEGGGPGGLGDSGQQAPKAAQRAVQKLANEGRITQELLMAISGSMPGSNPLHQKMTAEHVTQVLTLAAQHDEREFKLSENQQSIEASTDKRRDWLMITCFGLLLALVVFLCCLFVHQPVVLVPILSAVGGLVGGFLAGMGFNQVRRK